MEAARAGKRFAVVAQEVRILALKSNDTMSLSDQTVGKVKATSQSGASIGEIMEQILKLSGQVYSLLEETNQKLGNL